MVSLTGLSIAGAFVGVFFGADRQVGVFDAVEALLVEFFDEGDAPLAAGAGGEAFADEAGDGGFFALAVADDLALGDVEAEADVVVVVHGLIIEEKWARMHRMKTDETKARSNRPGCLPSCRSGSIRLNLMHPS